MTRHWTSDLHLGHTNIIRLCGRPFHTIAHMNAMLVANWNSVVAPGDDVMVLGDLCLGPIHDSLALLRSLNGRIILATGNHDRAWAGNGPKHDKWIDIYREAGVAEIIQGVTEAEIGGHIVDVCHFPYAGDSHTTDRYVSHRPADRGRVLLHGHCHEAWKTNGRQINVGTDVWNFTPVSDTELIPLIDAAAAAGQATAVTAN